jgi:hypothetical protein
MQRPIDLVRLFRDDYRAPRSPVLLAPHAASYLVIEGSGIAGSPTFTSRLDALYAVAYDVRAAHKTAGRIFRVPKLEGQWWADIERATIRDVPRDHWHWRLMLRMPDFVHRADVLDVIERRLVTTPNTLAAEVGLARVDEGECVQVLHVGPYDREWPTIDTLHEFAKSVGRTPRGHHHEIYLSDPRRVPPARLRTILRQPVRSD